MVDIPIFEVRRPDDWHAVALHLISKASAAPLSKADSEQYSRTIEEAWQRAQALIATDGGKKATEYSAAVTYHRTMLISLVLTIEPGIIHLSMTQIVVPMQMQKLSDAVATEAAKNILGQYEERQEGALPAVRHFYLRKL